jgi:hypothetical protein
MEISVASIDVSKETGVSIIRVRIKNVEPCSSRNYSRGMPEENNFCEKKGKIVCLFIDCTTPAPSVVFVGHSKGKFVPVHS